MLRNYWLFFKEEANKPVSIASLVYLRVIFGLVMAWESYRYLSKGWVTWIFSKPEHHLIEPGFQWLPLLTGPMWHVLWFTLGVLALMIAFGLFYRLAVILYTLLFTYQFLVMQENYLNHFYFVILILLPLCFAHPHHALSLDRRLHRVRATKTVPFWEHAIFLFLMGVVYFYGGIAKIDPDWVTGVPLNLWLEKHHDVPFIGQFLASEWGAVLMSWAGLLLDLFIVPALIWKRTRIVALITISLFHVSNHFLFQIGIFPWFSIGVTLMYLGPDFPERFFKWVKNTSQTPLDKFPQRPPQLKNFGTALLCLFVAYNILMPLRYHFLPGDPHWTERGHSYSWRMKLRNKWAETPTIFFKDRKTGKKWEHPATKWLTRKQINGIAKRPDLMLGFVEHLKEKYKKEGYEDLRIRVKARVSMNDRPMQRIITFRYNMDEAKECFLCYPDWIHPFQEKRSYKDSYERLIKRLEKEIK